MSTNNKTIKFPDSGKAGHYATQCHCPEEVDDWFKRCLENKPEYPYFTDDIDEVIEYANEIDNWQQKWFNQFRKVNNE